MYVDGDGDGDADMDLGAEVHVAVAVNVHGAVHDNVDVEDSNSSTNYRGRKVAVHKSDGSYIVGDGC